MQIIWKLKQGFAQDIISEVPEPKPPYNTTLSVVKSLERKGYVGHETFGKANRYYPRTLTDKRHRSPFSITLW